MLRTFAIDTLGCKVNQYESQQIRAQLLGFGLEPVSHQDKPDITIINTCCVTKKASAKSRQHIQKSKKLNHNSIIIIVGCLTSAPQQELTLTADNIYMIKNRLNIAAELNAIISKDTAPKVGHR